MISNEDSGVQKPMIAIWDCWKLTKESKENTSQSSQTKIFDINLKKYIIISM